MTTVAASLLDMGAGAAFDGISAEINGVDVTAKVQWSPSITWTDTVKGKGTSKMVIADFVGGVKPLEGQSCVIRDGATIIFDGIVRNPRRSMRGKYSANQLIWYSIDVSNLVYIGDKRRIWKAYNDATLTNIIIDLFADPKLMGDEGITIGTIDAAPAPITIKFNGVSGTEALNQLIDRAGDNRSWELAPGKVFNSQKMASLPGPVTLDESTFLQSGVLGATRVDAWDNKGEYGNVVTLRAGTDEMQITVTLRNDAEIAARKALEVGTSGIYDVYLERKDALSEAETESACQVALDRMSTMPLMVKGSTRTAGFAPGQNVPVNLPHLDSRLDNLTMYVESVNSAWVNGHFRYTLLLTSTEPSDGWQGYYRNPAPRSNTGPPQLIPDVGTVRVPPIPGLFGHDPDPIPGIFFTGDPSGTLDSTPSSIGLMNRRLSGTGTGNFMITLRRGPVAVPRQAIMEKWWIDPDEKITQSPYTVFPWDELAANANYKDRLLISPNDTYAAFVQYGTPSKFGIVSIAGEGFRGSVDSTISAQSNAGEPVWIGNFVFWPNVDDGKVFVYNVTDPTAPIEIGFFTTSLTTITSLIPSVDGRYVYGVGQGGFVALDVSNPGSIVEVSALAAASYISLDANFDTTLLAAVSRANSADARVVTVKAAGGALTLIAETLVPLATSILDGAAAIFLDDSLLVFNAREATGVDTLKGYVFNLTKPAAPTLTSTISYTHASPGNLGPARTVAGNRALMVFNFNSNAQITRGIKQYDAVKPPEIFPVAPVRYGGTAIPEYARGNLLVAIGLDELAVIDPPPRPGMRLVSDLDLPGMAIWSSDVELTQVAIDDSDSPYVVPAGVVVVLADATLGPITVEYPAVADWPERLIITKNTGDGSNSVFIDPASTDTIDDADTLELADANAAAGAVAATQWEVVANVSSGNGAAQTPFIDGLITQTGTDADHDVKINPGSCSAPFTGNDGFIELLAPITKQIDATWAQGDNAGGRVGSLLANTEYNLILITQDSDGALDVMFDVSATGANAPSGWTARRRFWSVMTDGSSNVRGYTQIGDYCYFDNYPLDVVDTTGTPGTYGTATASIPPNVSGIFNVASGITNGVAVRFRWRATGSTNNTDKFVSRPTGNAESQVRLQVQGVLNVDSSSQFEYTLGAGTWDFVTIQTVGWIDDRGRNYVVKEATDDMLIPARTDKSSPWGEIGVVVDSTPDPFNNWTSHRAAFWDDGGIEGMTASVPLYPSWQGKTIRVYLMASHVSATAVGDVFLRMDVGPRSHKEAQGAPNDANSTRVDTTYTMNTVAAEGQNTPYIIDLGTFDVGADDVAMLFELSRIGNDAADTFTASIGAFYCLLVVDG